MTYIHLSILCQNINKIIWFTYRKNFEGLLNRKNFLDLKNFDKNIEFHKERKILTSDTGWGCMIRVAQMILARVLYLEKSSESEVKIQEDYFRGNSESISSAMEFKDVDDQEDGLKRSIVKMFLDNVRDQKVTFYYLTLRLVSVFKILWNTVLFI